jgi:hypothetical protein
MWRNASFRAAQALNAELLYRIPEIDRTADRARRRGQPSACMSCSSYPDLYHGDESGADMRGHIVGEIEGNACLEEAHDFLRVG